MAVTRNVSLLISVSGTLAVGFIDYLTGIEIRVFPLYFLPLAYSAWHAGKAETLFIAGLASVVWLVTMYLSGREYSHAYIWVINFFTQGGSFLVVALLLSELHGLLERERITSRSDSLTGLANSRAFYELAGNALALCRRNLRPVTLAFVDLDNFKRANDTLGHQEGDRLLRKVAEILTAQLRSSDIAARMGGDEFAILLPEASAEDAQIALEKVRHELEQSREFRACSVTASMGAVAYLTAPFNLDEMVKAADDFMYEVKKSSKNRVLVVRMGETAGEG